MYNVYIHTYMCVCSCYDASLLTFITKVTFLRVLLPSQMIKKHLKFEAI